MGDENVPLNTVDGHMPPRLDENELPEIAIEPDAEIVDVPQLVVVHPHCVT